MTFIKGSDIVAKGQIKQKQATINQNTFESLCAIQCTREEICGVLNVSKETLLRWCKNTYNTDFETIFKEKRENGKASLRRMQWKLAEKNATMGIWLGKQYLEQKDNIDVNANQKIERVEIVNDLPKENENAD